MHVKGERREYYTTEKDVWTLFRIIARERKKREVDPTIHVLRDSMVELNKMSNTEGQYERQQLQNLLDFFETGVSIYEEIEARNPTSILLATTLNIKKIIF